MRIQISKLGEVLTVVIEEDYDVFTIESINELLRNDLMFKGIKKISVDCSKLKFLDSFGGEIFLLKKKFNIEQMEFVGLDDKLRPIFNVFSQEIFNKDLVELT